MEHKQVVESLATLISRVGDIEQAIVQLGQCTTGPVALAVERTREGTSLLRGLLWSAHMAVEAERERLQGNRRSLP
jgi:hypothetical protein